MVVPLDPDLGSFFGDGTGGARRLHSYALSRPQRFVLRDAEEYAASLQMLSLNGSAEPAVVAARVVTLLERHATPHAFCIRLLNPNVDGFNAVQNFFDNTVRSSLRDKGFENIEVGRNRATEQFINSDIFNQLHYADVAVADLTGLRSNNFIEAGYALGRELPVIFTAMHGTSLPFDVQAIPVFFWNPDEHDLDRRRKFLEHWELYVRRPAVVSRRELG